MSLECWQVCRVMGPGPRTQVSVAVTDQWECEAMERCGDPATAKRLTAARYHARTRRPDASATRIIRAAGGPRAEGRDDG